MSEWLLTYYAASEMSNCHRHPANVSITMISNGQSDSCTTVGASRAMTLRRHGVFPILIYLNHTSINRKVIEFQAIIFNCVWVEFYFRNPFGCSNAARFQIQFKTEWSYLQHQTFLWEFSFLVFYDEKTCQDHPTGIFFFLLQSLTDDQRLIWNLAGNGQIFILKVI